ncbi:MAG: ACP S-malonyltransferase [Candidatus Omnitrophica bacterium]|nr:ACP S-malonyltransferase [Candidatus Omnitrophota bacterium]
MGKAFYDRFDEAKAVYQSAKKRLGFDIAALCFEGPPEELTKTEKCQPALFVTSLAAFAAFKRVVPASLAPVASAGLSLGELTALAVAEAFSPEDGFYLVQARGEAMAECAAHHRGAMLAVIGLSGEAVDEICKKSGAVGANFNAADQVVLSGTVEAIEKAEGLAKERGAKRTIRLEVAGAFHSPLMQSAADVFKTALAKVEIKPPVFPIVSNVTGEPVTDPGKIRELLVKQIVSPVRWEASVRAMLKAGATHFIEFPPARVLTGLLRRIEKSASGLAVDTPEDFGKVAEALAIPLSI